MKRLTPQLYRDGHGTPLLVFGRGRKYFFAVRPETTIKVVRLETLRGLVELERKGKPYPPRRAASYWLNKSARDVTKAAKAILRGLVARRDNGGNNQEGK